MDAEQIQEAVIQQYDLLPRDGKPQKGEWTVLSAIVMETESNQLRVISLATGSKCMGSKERELWKYTAVGDCHAEVLCRRAFRFSLLNEIERAVKSYCERKDHPIFKVVISNEKGLLDIQLKENIKFHIYDSHTPCGDACIFPLGPNPTDIPKKEEKRRKLAEDLDPEISATPETHNDRKLVVDVGPEVNDDNTLNVESSEPPDKLAKKRERENMKRGKFGRPNELFAEDIQRTGGKPLGVKDPKDQGKNYHILGALRNKPGQGDPTLSVSCSDKLARWNYLGVQGALISMFMSSPIYLHSIVVADLFNLQSLERALLNRIRILDVTKRENQNQAANFKPNLNFQLRQCCQKFRHSRSIVTCDEQSCNPCYKSIVWAQSMTKNDDWSIHEILLGQKGRKYGSTNKQIFANAGKTWPTVCKGNYFIHFAKSMARLEDMLKNDDRQGAQRFLNDEATEKSIQTEKYLDVKKHATHYQEALTHFKQMEPFHHWPQVAASINDFTLHSIGFTQ